jgi:hypothetical protein
MVFAYHPKEGMMPYGPGKWCYDCNFGHTPDECGSNPANYMKVYSIDLGNGNIILVGVDPHNHFIRIRSTYEGGPENENIPYEIWNKIVDAVAELRPEEDQVSLERWKKTAREWYEYWKEAVAQRDNAIAVADMLEAELEETQSQLNFLLGQVELLEVTEVGDEVERYILSPKPDAKAFWGARFDKRRRVDLSKFFSYEGGGEEVGDED